MMNGGNNNMDLGLSLGYSNNAIKTGLNNSPGAGVNAGSSTDMTFAASNPLSELVWSPHTGLSLRCADCSKADKKPFLLWNVGPSNMVPPLSQSIRSKGIDDDKIVDGNLILSNGMVHFEREGASLAQSPRNSTRPMIGSSNRPNMESSDNMVESNTEKRAPLGDDEDKEVSSHRIVQMANIASGSQRKTGHLNQNHIFQGSSDSDFDILISKPLSSKLHKEMSSSCNDIARAAVFGSQILAGVAAASELHTEVESGPCISPLLKSQCQDGPMKEGALATEEARKCKIKRSGSKLPLYEKLESTAENDLRHLLAKEAFWQSEERLLRGSSVPLEITPTNANQRKGKNKALSDGNFSGRFSNDEDDSNESVESCNSAGLLSRGKKRLKYVESIIVDSKRIKKQIDGSLASTSIARNDSSFMNWISNIKGFSKSNEEEAPSLALTLAHPNHGYASILQETIVCRERHHSVGRNMGFQTVFQSLYSPTTKLSEARVPRDDCTMEEARELVQADETNMGGFRISCTGQNDVSSDHNFISNDKIIPSITDAVGQSDKPCILTGSTPVQVDCGADLGEHKASSYSKRCGDREGINSFGFLGKQKTIAVDSANPVLASEGRAITAVSNSNKSNLFGSLWITRLSPKTDSTSFSLVHSKRTSCGTFEYPAVCATEYPQSQTNPDFAIELQSLEGKDNSGENAGGLLGKELQVFATSNESSIAFKEIRGHNHHNAGLSPNHILPSENFKSSEAMASVFAQRLDALKHIIPSGSKDGATCFFCGKCGHSLRDCSEVSETELECLLSNISSYDGAEDCPCLCIRCFQRDHWAVTCPIRSLSREQHLEIGNLKLCPSNERNSCFLEKEDHPKGAICGRGKTCTVTDLRKPTTDAEVCGHRTSSSVETQKHLISNPRGTEYQSFPTCNLDNTEIIDIPKGIFDAVRRLQVSRADILRMMNSHAFVSHLEGFFLRLRLGKSEAGFSESGYYVACITGQAGKSVKASKKSISVNIGGINCLVGSQYVSNDDFLEDELMAWWCRTLRSGGKLPSKYDLETKLKQRIKFGF